MNQYQTIKKQYQDCLVFFRLGDFYELFYEDAKIAAKELNITLTKRVQKNETIPMSGVPFHTCDHYISKLVSKGYKIALCEQIETPNDKNNKIINRDVVRIITSGTITEDTLLKANRNNYLMALSGNNLTISVALFDISTNEFIIEDIKKEHLKSYLDKIEPNEILISQSWLINFPEYSLWKEKITIIQEIPQYNTENIIKKFFNLHSNESISNFSLDNKTSIAIILSYLMHTQKKTIKIHFPTKKTNKEELLMDKFTRKNLEITKTLQNQTKGSLIWLLDETNTPQGARLLFKILNNPITNIEELNNRYDEIEYFINKKEILNDLIFNIKQIPDFERILSKILLNRSNPTELRNLAIGINNINNIAKSLNQNIKENNQLTNEILNTIKSDIPINNFKETEYIKEGISQELDELKNFNKNISQQLQNIENEYKAYTKINNLRIKNTHLGFLIEINSSQKDKLDYIFKQKQSLKTTIRYSTEQLDEINNKFFKCSELIKQKENEIFLEIIEKIKEIEEDIYFYSSYSSKIDVYSNFATISIEYNYIRPILTKENNFEIINSKHPILQKIFKNNGNQLIENDCILNKPIIFMTGPNMAGKSTYLRQQAIIALMAHCGIFIPAEYAKIGIIDQIFSRISTNDDLLQGNSTFMMEMIEISLTLNQASNKSFLILDEIGRGTCAQEGMALAQAILEYLLNKLKARTIFSTHYIQIGSIEHKNIQKKMLQIHSNPLYFTYKVIDGISSKSYAIEVAKLAGMPFEIINRAEILLKNK